MKPELIERDPFEQSPFPLNGVIYNRVRRLIYTMDTRDLLRKTYRGMVSDNNGLLANASMQAAYISNFQSADAIEGALVSYDFLKASSNFRGGILPSLSMVELEEYKKMMVRLEGRLENWRSFSLKRMDNLENREPTWVEGIKATAPRIIFTGDFDMFYYGATFCIGAFQTRYEIPLL